MSRCDFVAGARSRGACTKHTPSNAARDLASRPKIAPHTLFKMSPTRLPAPPDPQFFGFSPLFKKFFRQASPAVSAVRGIVAPRPRPG